MAIEFEKHCGPAKCWKCGIYIEADVEYYIAKGMAGRPSFDKEQFIQAEPQFCQRCYEKIRK